MVDYVCVSGCVSFCDVSGVFVCWLWSEINEGVSSSLKMMVRHLIWASTGLSACDWLVNMAVLVLNDLTCVLHMVLDVSWTGALNP